MSIMMLIHLIYLGVKSIQAQKKFTSGDLGKCVWMAARCV